MPDLLKLKVLSAVALTDAIREIVLENAEAAPLPAFDAGAHLKFSTPAGERSYSLVGLAQKDDFSAPDRYRIAVQREVESQGGSVHMHELQPGDMIEARGPVNDFPLVRGQPALLIAGGIGVTPLVSMASLLEHDNIPYRFHYTCRSKGFMAFSDELPQRFGDNLTAHFDDEDESRADVRSLAQSLQPDEHLYVCGPKGMIEAVKSAAEAAGVQQDRIHFELFTTPSAEAGDETFEVVLNSTGGVYQVPPGKTIIEVLEENGVDLIYDCQRGDCGICQTGIIEGVPDHRDVVLSDAEKNEGKLMQICVSRAKSPRLVLDI